GAGGGGWPAETAREAPPGPPAPRPGGPRARPTCASGREPARTAGTPPALRRREAGRRRESWSRPASPAPDRSTSASGGLQRAGPSAARRGTRRDRTATSPFPPPHGERGRDASAGRRPGGVPPRTTPAPH